MAPMGRIRVGPFKAAGHRMALAQVSESWLESTVGCAPARLRRQNYIERRAPDAGLAGVIGSRSDKHRAALADIARDVIEVDDRQHALSRISIKDDELKVVDLLLKQFTRRESDQ